jgi:hypothetical protein
MNYSNKEKKRRQHLKELNSLRNRMGKNIIWFDSLNKGQQYDVLFMWKREKKDNKLTIPETTLFRERIFDVVKGRLKLVLKEIEVISYPPKLKYFLKNIKPNFSININDMRETSLMHILNSKK